MSPVYFYIGIWKNPFSHDVRTIFVVGIDPADSVLDAPGVSEGLPTIRQRDHVLFDADSRPEFGEVIKHVALGERVRNEINQREVEVAGLFRLGTSFGIDASVLTSDTNFLRLFPGRPRTQIDLGLIQLQPGSDVKAAQERLRSLLPRDVVVLKRAEFAERERAHWGSTTPIGYVFTFGTIMGFVVGCIIVYQIPLRTCRITCPSTPRSRPSATRTGICPGWYYSRP